MGRVAGPPGPVGRAAVIVAAGAGRSALAGRPPMALATARAESTAELLCAELAVDGLPMDRAVAEAS